MNKPFVLRITPPWLRQSIAFRVYLSKYKKYHDLYAYAPLAFCPTVAMHNLVPGDIISGGIAFCGFYELELSKAIVKLAPTGSVFVDVGANLGYFSLLWAGLNPAARVIAFEASPRNIKLLESNIVKNRFGDRIAVVPKAAGHKSGTVNFNIGPAAQTGWGSISKAKSETNVEVSLVRLDDELPDTIIDVLKIDVEGADTWVLYGCEKLLKKRQIHKIFFEVNDERMAELGIGANEARDFLESVGYTCKPFGKRGGEWVAYPDLQTGQRQKKANN